MPGRPRAFPFLVSSFDRIMTRKSKQPNAPEIVEVDRTELEGVIARAEQSLDKADGEYIRAVFESYEYITGLLDDKDTSIDRLRKLLFGSSSEKTDAVIGDSSSEEEEGHDEADNDDPTSEDELSNANDANSAEQELPAELLDDGSSSAPGHGRNGADAYRGAKQVDVPHDCYAPGDPCPWRQALRQDTRRADPHRRTSSAASDDLSVAEVALPSMWQDLHGVCSARGGRREV